MANSPILASFFCKDKQVLQAMWKWQLPSSGDFLRLILSDGSATGYVVQHVVFTYADRDGEGSATVNIHLD